jgi:osmotically-inducible protein OsmY
VILDRFLTDPARFTVTVKDGIVTIMGTPETAAVGHDIINEARHVEGVVAVRDRLSYPPAERYTPGPGPLF